MGKIKQSALGGVSGTIGNLVGSSWKGIPYLRSRPAVYHDANTPKQSKQRSRLSGCSKLSKSLKFTVIRPVWDSKAIQMSGHNLFIRKNIAAFDKSGNISSYEMLKFSLGDLPLPNDISVQVNPESPGEIQLTWTDNSRVGIAAETDKLRVVALKGNEPLVVTGLSFTRITRQASIRLPFGAGEAVHVYVFFEDEANENYSGSFHALVNIPAVPNP